jgi:hypothetical protein
MINIRVLCSKLIIPLILYIYIYILYTLRRCVLVAASKLDEQSLGRWCGGEMGK